MIFFEPENELCLKANVKVIMKSIFVTTLFFLLSSSMFAQKINGQWRGYFNSNGDIVLSGGDNTEYVLELEIADNGNGFSGEKDLSTSFGMKLVHTLVEQLNGNIIKQNLNGTSYKILINTNS